MSFFERLFGKPDASQQRTDDEDGDIANRYFQLSEEIQSAKRDGDYARAIRAARETYKILPAFVREYKREAGSFTISTSHAVHTAPRLMAIVGDRDGIRELHAVLEAVEDLHDWIPSAEAAEIEVEAVPRIFSIIQAEPGVLQSALKSRLDDAMADHVTSLCSALEKAERIYRVKKGSSYQLYPAGFKIPTSSGASRSPQSAPSASAPSSLGNQLTPRAKIRRAAAQARLLEFDGSPIVRLPKAPASWEARESGSDVSAAAEDRKAQPRFQVEGKGWSIGTEEKLAAADRPNAAFKDVLPAARFTYWVDPKGKREGFEYAASVLRVTDHNGKVVAERGLAHDIYRSDVNPTGSAALFLSTKGVLHGYTDALDLFIEESLFELPEYQAQATRLDIEPRNLKNYTRCVAISSDRSRYIVTVVDEAWCIEAATGRVVWGVRMPSKEGWTRVVAERSARTGTSTEVDEALRVMELSLPVSPEEITRQYRALAMRWHPDRNPGDRGATARFQALGAAMELLTGINLAALTASELDRVTYRQALTTTHIQVPDGRGGSIGAEFSVSLEVGESFASDWIYAANFGANGHGFLAGYSGKVVVISPDGVAECVYDIGAVPRHIVDAGDHLYILTDTRLYVLHDDWLEALVDVYGASDVIVADRGFALLESKTFEWFTPAGERVGIVRTKDPIRRVMSTDSGLVIETRQHRALVIGAPAWWDRRS